MSEASKYVSPEYQERLNKLAELLIAGRRFGSIALRETIEVGDNESQLLLFETEETLVL